MRVLLHSKTFYPSVGGIERVSQTLAGTLWNHGIDLRVVTDTPLGDKPELGPYPVVRVPSARRLRTLVREADVAHANGFSLQLLPYCLLYRKPIIWTHAGHQASCLIGEGRHQGQPCQHRWHRCFLLTRRDRGVSFALLRSANWLSHRLALGFAASNVGVSDWVTGNIRAPRSLTIWNPVDIHTFGHSSQPGCRGCFTFLGRLVAQKGVDVLLKALSICRIRQKLYSLEIYGDGPQRRTLEELSRELGCSECVRFHGMVEREDLTSAVCKAWVITAPSTYEEAMGVVAVEAMAAGKPLIVSRHGGLAEVASGSSLTFENGDAEQLAAQMIRLAEDDDLRNALAREGPKRAQLFDPNRICEAYIALYQAVIRNQRSRHTYFSALGLM
jgi:glycogen(starch) synthase